jgi:hypothetical protein
VTVKVYVPRCVEELTTTFSVEEVVAVFGLNVPVAPAGSAVTEKVTEELKPPVGVIVTM